MKRSSDRILSTHAGSLPRPADIRTMVGLNPGTRDAAADAVTLKAAVNDVVRKQLDIGLDVVDDGEFSKPSFVTYIRNRLGGLEPIGGTRSAHWSASRDSRQFPEYYSKQVVGAVGQLNYGCTGAIHYKGLDHLKNDLDNLKAALNGSSAEAFVPAIAPANIEGWNVNKFYKTEEEYRIAIADAMRVEYKAIIDAGFLLQIDDPRLVTYWMMRPELSLEDCRKWAQMQVEVLNHALRGLPREKIRYHTCYSIDSGPRVNDMPAKNIIDILMKIHAGAFSFEASNPRHEHEWTVWRDAKRPDGTILIPGLVTHSTFLVEAPELVAERLLKYVNFAGRENVIAGNDCGFASFAGNQDIDPTIAWLKLEALVQGAELATKQLKAKPNAPKQKSAKPASATAKKAQEAKAAKAKAAAKKKPRR